MSRASIVCALVSGIGGPWLQRTRRVGDEQVQLRAGHGAARAATMKRSGDGVPQAASASAAATAAAAPAARGRRDAAHAATATPPRRGSPAPLSAPVVGVAADGLHAAEEHVRRAEVLHDVGVEAQRVERGAGLGEDDVVLEVHARRGDRVAGRQAVVDDADDRLQQRRADAVGARRAERELHLAVRA